MKRGALITARDEALFRYIAESKVASSRHLLANFFTKVHERTALKRLQKLSKDHLLVRRGYWEGRGLHLVYELPEDIFEQHLSGMQGFDRRPQLRSEVLGHDLDLTELRASLQKLPSVKRYLTENMIQSDASLYENEPFRAFKSLNSDAAIEFRAADGTPFTVPLEFERSRKSPARMRKKLLDYYLTYDGKAVLYVCKTPQIERELVEAERSLGKEFEPKMYFAQWAEVLKPEQKVIFLRGAKDKKIVL